MTSDQLKNCVISSTRDSIRETAGTMEIGLAVIHTALWEIAYQVAVMNERENVTHRCQRIGIRDNNVWRCTGLENHEGDCKE